MNVYGKNGSCQQATLCWECENSIKPHVCPWVRDYTPVKGWEAKPTHIGGAYQYDSYIVTNCPLFKRDAFNGGMVADVFLKHPRIEIDDQDVVNIAEAIIERQIEDWRFLECGRLDNITFCGGRIKREHCLEFFFSPWFEQLLASFSERTPQEIRSFIGIYEYMRPERKG